MGRLSQLKGERGARDIRRLRQINSSSRNITFVALIAMSLSSPSVSFEYNRRYSRENFKTK